MAAPTSSFIRSLCRSTRSDFSSRACSPPPRASMHSLAARLTSSNRFSSGPSTRITCSRHASGRSARSSRVRNTLTASRDLCSSPRHRSSVGEVSRRQRESWASRASRDSRQPLSCAAARVRVSRIWWATPPLFLALAASTLFLAPAAWTLFRASAASPLFSAPTASSGSSCFASCTASASARRPTAWVSMVPSPVAPPTSISGRPSASGPAKFGSSGRASRRGCAGTSCGPRRSCGSCRKSFHPVSSLSLPPASLGLFLDSLRSAPCGASSPRSRCSSACRSGCAS
mmetsp:Transcript_1838/g.6040  ORF Transcript_1838/g.6040 Transcript_1838/m.6040 type:complete len:287 (-) Transcript_1838:363-1223(-)